MTRTLALLLACCLPLAACTQSSTPPAASAQASADPAQLALDAWLEAFNSGERAQLEVFRDRWKPGMDVDELLELHAETGGFRLVRREPSEPGTAYALLQELESDTVVRMEMTVKTGEPARFGIRPIDPPEDLRVPRMTATDAIDALVAKADEQAAKDAFSGVLLVANGDEVLLQRAWGLADRAAGTPVTPDTK